MSYLRRIADAELNDLFGAVPAIALDGPQGVGKTTTAEQPAIGMAKLVSMSVRSDRR